jgi:mono/diheme cytochrome c family protein
MTKRSLALMALGLCTATFLVPPAALPQQAREAAGTAAVSDPRMVLSTYCFTCHNQRLKTAGLTLDQLDLKKAGNDAEIWEKVLLKLRVGVMPPQGMPQPDAAARNGLISWLGTTLDAASAAHPYPGHPSVHRLNRAEYANAIRDLFALDVDPVTLLPADDPAYGFDNIGEVLGLSQALLEQYASAAGQIATLAIGDAGDVVPGATVFRAAPDLSQDKHNEGLPLGTTGGFLARPTLPLDGEYEIKTTMFKTNLGLIRGLEFPRDLNFIVDGQRVFSMSIGGAKDFTDLLRNQTKAGEDLEARLHVVVPLKAGPHAIGATFAQRSEVENSRRLEAMLRTTSDTSETMIGPPHIETLTVTGPFHPTGPGNTPSRQKIFTCRPARTADEETCARNILNALAHRAYRGMDTAADRDELLKFYRQGRSEGSSKSIAEGFDQGIGLAVQRLLTGPKFLLRIERDPEGPANTAHKVSDLDLASRLSFFLWSSIPDDTLLQLASRGQLSSPAVLEQQVRRMLADDRSRALVDNFAGQWLQLRNLRSAYPDSREFPNFDDQLRQAFRIETEMLFESVMREDRNVIDLLTADYTFANERLAQHYGIPNIFGDQFRRVPITEEARKGLLGQGSILVVTSHSDRTSPVVRGKWILDTLLGAPPAPPPPNVPPLKEAQALPRPMTMRERMEQHRANPACAGCHKVLDPVGFALENFDASGAWRARDGRQSIDASGVFVDGTKVTGPVELRAAILRHPENFVTALTAKLMIYGLGRGIDYHDMPAVRSIVSNAASQNYRFSSLVLGIVESFPFENRAKAVEEPAVTAAAKSPSRASQATEPVPARTVAVEEPAVTAAAKNPSPANQTTELVPARTVRDGVYTTAQAERGKAQYTIFCSACHGADLAGTNSADAGAPALQREGFRDGSNANSLFAFIRDRMPADAPGSLTDDSYRDILAYLFEQNGFPAGNQELKSDEQALAKIRIVKSTGAH